MSLLYCILNLGLSSTWQACTEECTSVLFKQHIIPFDPLAEASLTGHACSESSVFVKKLLVMSWRGGSQQWQCQRSGPLLQSNADSRLNETKIQTIFYF